MYEDEMIVAIWVAIALAFWVVKLKWTNRKLRKKVAALEQLPTVAAGPTPAAPPVPPQLVAEQSPEMARLRARIEVLERIATDGNHSLEREIEALRRA